MTKIFSKLRKGVIGQKGTRRYLLYAVGEVILIVMGVLIAIQVNNWNEKRKNNKLKQSYFNSLIIDLKADLKQLSNATERFNAELAIIKSYKVRLTNSETSIDTLYKIAKEEFNPSIPPFVRYNLTTLETLKSTGDIGLIEKNILNELNSLQDLQNEQQYYEEATLMTHGNLLESYLQSYTIYMGVINKGALYEMTWNQVNASDLILKFNALLTIKMAALESAVRYYEKIEERTNMILKMIEDEIE